MRGGRGGGKGGGGGGGGGGAGGGGDGGGGGARGNDGPRTGRSGGRGGGSGGTGSRKEGGGRGGGGGHGAKRRRSQRGKKQGVIPGVAGEVPNSSKHSSSCSSGGVVHAKLVRVDEQSPGRLFLALHLIFVVFILLVVCVL